MKKYSSLMFFIKSLTLIITLCLFVNINICQALMMEGTWTSDTSGPDGVLLQLGTWDQNVIGIYPDYAGSTADSRSSDGVQWRIENIVRTDGYAMKDWTKVGLASWQNKITERLDHGTLSAPNWGEGDTLDEFYGTVTYTQTHNYYGNGYYDFKVDVTDMEWHNTFYYEDIYGDNWKVSTIGVFNDIFNLTLNHYDPLNFTMDYNGPLSGVVTYAQVDIIKDFDKDGIGDSLESNLDGNHDGISDYLQNNVTTLKTSNPQNTITLENVSETPLHDVKLVEAEALITEGLIEEKFAENFVLGFYDFFLDADSDGTTTMTLHLPEGETPSSYWKFGPTPESPEQAIWYEWLYNGTTGAEIDGNTITLHFVDGQLGDDDLTVNGTIYDMGAPQFSSTTVPIPCALWLLVSGLIGLVGIRRKFQK